MPKLIQNTPLHDKIREGVIDSGMEGKNDTQVNVFIKRDKEKFDDDFTFLFIGKQNEIIRNISPIGAKVFLWFCCEMMYGNFVEILQKRLAILINVSESSLKRAIKELIDSKVIIPYKNANDTRQNFYIINPIHSWRGNAKERTKALKEINKQMSIEF